MALEIKHIKGNSIQVENETGHWILFTLDELRAPRASLPVDVVSGPTTLSPEEAAFFGWTAFTAARGFAIEHGLIEDVDR